MTAKGRVPNIKPHSGSRSQRRDVSEVMGIVDCKRGVIRKYFVLVDAARPHRRRETRRGGRVVEAPADVLGPGVTMVAPLRIALGHRELLGLDGWFRSRKSASTIYLSHDLGLHRPANRPHLAGQVPAWAWRS